MPYVSYDEIEHLIDHAEHDGGRMKVMFACPHSQQVVQATGLIPRNFAHGLADDAAQGLVRQLLHMLTQLIRQLTGMYISFGRAANGVNRGHVLATADDKRNAVVAAFESVAEYPGKPRRPGRFNHQDGAWVFVP